MKIKIDYGKNGLWIDVPENNLGKILAMKNQDPIANPIQSVKKALESPIASPPLAQLARGKKSACIVICDITRPVPNRILLPPILSTLEECGIQKGNITILIATGIHRPNLDDELIYLVGEEIASRYHIVNHFARNKETHSYLGKTSRGSDVYIDSTYINSDLKITTGFIEPHLMAGFSGGRKLICPGIASLETVKFMHSPDILEHPNAREGIIAGNPFHEESLEIARMAGVNFILNVALDEKRQITGIFAGDLIKAHAQGVNFVKEQVSDSVAEPVDIVITSSAGFPLDTTFYQSIKGLTAALPIVKKNGTIILAAQCQEGLGSLEFSQLMRETTDINQFLRNIYREDYFIIDQWQFEELARVLRQVDVYLYSEGISREDSVRRFTRTINSVAEGITMALDRHGENARIAVIPKGPYILAEILPLKKKPSGNPEGFNSLPL